MSDDAIAPPPRIGFFGGAFDPPHLTHVRLAREALAQGRLQELRIFPTGHAWHKARTLSPAVHRVEMARLAFGELPGVVIDDRETHRDGPTYTLDTLRELQAERPGAQLVLLLGTDQVQALPTWHGWQEMLTFAIVLIAVRADGAGAAARFDPYSLPGLPAAARFEWLALQPEATSATDIRARAAKDEDLSRLVPPAVARYIAQHHLYRPT